MKGAISLLLLCAAITTAKNIRSFNLTPLKAAESVEVNENGCPLDASIEKLIPHKNCRQFYQCWAGSLVVHSCAANLYYNPKKWQCDYPELVDCEGRDVDEQSDNVAEIINESPKEEVSEKPAIFCAKRGYESQIFPHQNCNQFYLCAEDITEVLSCPSDLLYNTETKKCDWPSKVECGDRIVPGSTENNASEGKSSNEVEEESTPEENVPEENNNESNEGSIGNGEVSSICQDGAHILSHKNCNQFYVCANGVPVEFSCPGALFYSPKTEACEWSNTVECGDRIVPTDVSDAPTTAAPIVTSVPIGTAIPIVTSVPIGTASPIVTPAPAAVDSEEQINIIDDSKCWYSGQIIPNEKCNKFSLCAHGVPVAMNCPADLLYNPETKECDWSSNVDCGDRIVPGGSEDVIQVIYSEENESDSDEESAPEAPSTAAPIIISTKPAPAESEDNINESNEGSNGNGSGPCKDGAEIVSHEKCNKFYVCANGVPVEFSCPGALFYSPKTEACEWSNTVECGDRIVPTDVSDAPTTAAPIVTSVPIGTAIPIVTSVPIGTASPIVTPAPAAVDSEEQINIIDDSKCWYSGQIIPNEKCNKFSLCAHGVPVAMNCPADLLYNPETKECDWSSNVDCGDRIVPGGSEDVIQVIYSEENESDSDEESAPEAPSTAAPIIISTKPAPAETEENINESNEGSNGNGSGPCKDGAEIVSHEKCNKFYVCANGVPVEFSCPGALFYSPKTEACEWSNTVDCGDRIVPKDESDAPTTAAPTVTSVPIGTAIPIVTSVPIGTASPIVTEAPALVNSEEDNNVDDSQCWYSGQIIPNEKCNKFNLCANGVPVAMSCPAGLLFNPEVKVCDWPYSVDCGDRVIPGESESDSSEDAQTTAAPSVTSVPIGTASPIVTSVPIGTASPIVTAAPIGTAAPLETISVATPPPSEESAEDTVEQSPGSYDVCKLRSFDGHAFPHEHCNQYYLCAHGTSTAMFCPNVLLYNPDIRRCDWPHNVNCGDRTISVVPAF